MIPHLWKEWRDHRAVILGIAALLPPVLFAAMLLIPEDVVALPTAGAAAGLAAAAFALGADLVPGEIRRGTMLFLKRLPSGLGAVFAAKAVLLVGAIAASATLGYGIGSLAQKVAGRPAAALDWTYAPEALAVALWVFAVAMWLPRGELAVPATALCLGVFLLPMHLLLEWNPGMKLPAAAMSVGRWALVPGALLVAWLSFRGRRFGGPWGSAWRGLLVTLVLFTPAWGYVANRAAEWRRFDPRDPECRLEDGFVGVGGRYVFVNARCGGPNHAILVDLAEGSSIGIGAPRDEFRVPARGWLATVPVVAHAEESTRDRRHVWENYYDGATGGRFKSGWSDMRIDEVEVMRRRPVKSPPDVKLPEGLTVLAVLDDGAVVAIRDHRAIVRVKDGQEEQVFPR
ncbi:MAG TPA: hypothetical protein VFY93_13235 [Planctomycetota bacterium]|nr:hypothetical protein [Planctomycetota bacterium]